VGSGGAAAGATAAPLNEPGHWDFFLSHGQAAAGDQCARLCLLLRQHGRSVWYDNEMADRSTAAMEEGVRHSAKVRRSLVRAPARYRWVSKQERLRFPCVSIHCICGSYHACCVHWAKVLLFLSGDTAVPQSDLAWCAAVLVTWVTD
jgi:hypothetical protein